MTIQSSPLRAIDLYSGIGGWSLGLKLAGIDVIASYDRCKAANETNNKNNGHEAQAVDLRHLSMEDLPTSVDIVVGSPPCREFSYSNRGGQGDIRDGLEDIILFLSVVEHLRPRIWAMENVPRVAGIMEAELVPGGRLERFAPLAMETHVVNMVEFATPTATPSLHCGKFRLCTPRFLF